MAGDELMLRDGLRKSSVEERRSHRGPREEGISTGLAARLAGGQTTRPTAKAPHVQYTRLGGESVLGLGRPIMGTYKGNGRSSMTNWIVENSVLVPWDLQVPGW